MFKRFFKIVVHLIIIVLLTVLTQIGGVFYLLPLFIIKRKTNRYRIKRFLCFIALYGLATIFLIPNIATYFGREPVKESTYIEAHSFFYKLSNRNYVTPALNIVLEKTATKLQQKYPGVKLVHLDANFPFIDGFPLLPHLSHNDGKKIDVSFVYKDSFGNVTNLKPALSGYGVYETPKVNEVNQSEICKGKGYWQYDFPKYLTFGTINKNLSISEEVTRDLSLNFLKHKSVSKLFIEPHLKIRLGLTANKVRFHGCQAVRHDDHIHVQVK